MALTDLPRPSPDPAGPSGRRRGSPHPAPPDPAVVRVRDPGELLAAVPTMLGFHPRESLVLVATGGRSGKRLGLTVRVDLPPPEHAAEVAATVVRGLLRDAPTGAVVIVVGAPGGAGPPARNLVDLVVARLQECHIDVHTVIWSPGTSAGDRWECFDPCRCTGVLPDPSATPLAATAVAGGQVVLAGRAELAGLVAPVDVALLRRRELALIRVTDRVLATGDDEPDPDLLPVVDAALADARAGRLVLDDARVVALAGALVVPAVRDAALLRTADLDASDAAAAEYLWAALTRETPDPEAAEPAALLAVSALLRGDGALANVALDRAERAWPGHRLTALLRSVADVGIRPADLRECLGSAMPAPAQAGSARRACRPRRAG